MRIQSTEAPKVSLVQASQLIFILKHSWFLCALHILKYILLPQAQLMPLCITPSEVHTSSSRACWCLCALYLLKYILLSQAQLMPLCITPSEVHTSSSADALCITLSEVHTSSSSACWCLCALHLLKYILLPQVQLMPLCITPSEVHTSSSSAADASVHYTFWSPCQYFESSRDMEKHMPTNTINVDVYMNHSNCWHIIAKVKPWNKWKK